MKKSFDSTRCPVVYLCITSTPVVAFAEKKPSRRALFTTEGEIGTEKQEHFLLME